MDIYEHIFTEAFTAPGCAFTGVTGQLAYTSVAQAVERLPETVRVGGSIPSRGTAQKP